MKILKKIFNPVAKIFRFADKASTKVLQTVSDTNDAIVDRIEASVDKNARKTDKRLYEAVTGGSLGNVFAYYMTPARYIAKCGRLAAVPFSVAGGITRGIAKITFRKLD